MSWDFSDFHFIRPLYLWAIPALMLIWYCLGRSLRNTAWDKIINKEMLKVLRIQAGSSITLWRWGLLLAWTIVVIASAGPSWTKIPAPTFKNQLATVILLDLSRSMLAEDLSPNRLTRAKFKLIDILRQQKDGQVALVAYAGDAYAVSPLTDDPRTIEALLPALSPNIMPSQGSNTEAAVAMASQLLRDAKVGAGNILLLTDGISLDAQRRIQADLSNSHSLSIIGIGSSDPTPIPARDGGFLKNSDGEIVLTQLDSNELQSLAQSKNGGYANIQNDDSDVQQLLSDEYNAGIREQESQAGNDSRFDSWADMGHWLIVLILPFAAFAFRRGLIFTLPAFVIASFLVPETSFAQQDSNARFQWQDLWQTSDQQASELFKQGDYENAARTFDDKDWQASAHYKNGDYEIAQKQFEQNQDATSKYNLANTLALQGELDKAIDLLEQVLSEQPNNDDAAHNKKVLEQLKDQQQNQDQENQDQENQDQQNQDQQNQEQQNQEQQNQEQQNQEQQNQDQQNQDQQNQDQQNQDQQNQDQQNQDQENQDQNKEESEPEEQEPQPGQQEPQPQEQEPQPQEQEPQPQEQEPQPAQVTPEDLGDANEQWLRGIPDDPSGFLRRKFKSQSDQRKPVDRKQAERY